MARVTGRRLVRSGSALAAEVDGETVLYDPDANRYVGLRATGGRIWELLESPHSLEELVDVLTGEFEVDPVTCRSEVDRFVSILESAGFVAVTVD